MPGTTRGELLEMELLDAVAILLAGVVDDELQQAARHVVECRADVRKFEWRPVVVAH
jgi:hypothetical protein